MANIRPHIAPMNFGIRRSFVAHALLAQSICNCQDIQLLSVFRPRHHSLYVNLFLLVKLNARSSVHAMTLARSDTARSSCAPAPRRHVPRVATRRYASHENSCSRTTPFRARCLADAIPRTPTTQTTAAVRRSGPTRARNPDPQTPPRFPDAPTRDSVRSEDQP